MDAFIKAAFWTDTRIEALTSDEKLAALWLITNPNRDLLGFTQASNQRFEFETRLEGVANPSEGVSHHLQGVCKGLPTSFVQVSEGLYFCRNFLRHQLGKGGALNFRNNVLKSVIKQARTLPQEMMNVFLDAYPELREFVLDECASATPCQPLPRGGQVAEKSRAEQSREEIFRGKSAEKGEDPEMVERIRLAYPRHTHVRDTCELIAAAIRRHNGPASDILEGTLAVAKIVADWPPNEKLRFLKTPTDFFAGDHWLDDPSFWVSHRQARLDDIQAQQPQRIAPDIGGRKPARVASITQ